MNRQNREIVQVFLLSFEGGSEPSSPCWFVMTAVSWLDIRSPKSVVELDRYKVGHHVTSPLRDKDTRISQALFSVRLNHSVFFYFDDLPTSPKVHASSIKSNLTISLYLPLKIRKISRNG